jgi:hypothetical protein
MSTMCDHAFVYEPALGGYTIVCRKCGDIHGSSESADPKFLAGFNRNTALLKARRARRAGKRVSR